MKHRGNIQTYISKKDAAKLKKLLLKHREQIASLPRNLDDEKLHDQLDKLTLEFKRKLAEIQLSDQVRKKALEQHFKYRQEHVTSNADINSEVYKAYHEKNYQLPENASWYDYFKYVGMKYLEISSDWNLAKSIYGNNDTTTKISTYKIHNIESMTTSSYSNVINAGPSIFGNFHKARYLSKVDKLNEYILVIKDKVSKKQIEQMLSYVSNDDNPIKYHYLENVGEVFVTMTAEQAAKINDDRIASIEKNGLIEVDVTTNLATNTKKNKNKKGSNKKRRKLKKKNKSNSVGSNINTGSSTVDYDVKGIDAGYYSDLDAIFGVGLDHSYVKINGVENGKSVGLYVVDSGVDKDHPLVPNVKCSKDHNQDHINHNSEDTCAHVDNSGHGTHVAHIAARLFPFKYIISEKCVETDGYNSATGTHAAVIAAIDAAITDFKTRKQTGDLDAAVMNISLSSGPHQGFENAVNRAVSAGIVVVVAGGNVRSDACNYSPSKNPNAITVGGTNPKNGNKYNKNGYGTNYGPCVDIYAPSEGIVAANSKYSKYGKDVQEVEKDGTSMGSPQVAGVAAYYLAMGYSPNSIRTHLLNDAYVNKKSQ